MAATKMQQVENRDLAVVLGCPIDRLDMAQSLERCRQLIERGNLTQQVSINAAKIVAMRSDPELREVITRCGLVNADGQAVVWASRLLDDPLPERVAGIDLMFGLIEMAQQEGYAIYILGARQDVLDSAVGQLRRRFPRLEIVGYRNGYFHDEESPEIVREIRDSGAQILFVAISSPRKEHWLGEHGRALGVPLTMGVGGAIDIVAGVTRRAPRAWQRAGLEWLYRLLQEPRRMLRRYLVSNARFAMLLAWAVTRRTALRLAGDLRGHQRTRY